MNVKITRNIPISDVSKTASDILEPACEGANDINKWIQNLYEELKTNKRTAMLAWLDIKRIRSVLGSLDQTLFDVENIMKGLAEYENQQNMTQ